MSIFSKRTHYDSSSHRNAQTDLNHDDQGNRRAWICAMTVADREQSHLFPARTAPYIYTSAQETTRIDHESGCGECTQVDIPRSSA